MPNNLNNSQTTPRLPAAREPPSLATAGLHIEQKMRDTNTNARNKDRSLQGAAAWKGSRGDSCSFKHDLNKKGKGQEEDSVLLPKREDSRKETQKQLPTGRTQRYQSVRKSRTSRYATILRRSNTRMDPHAIVGTHYPPDRSHYRSQSGCKWRDTCVFKQKERAGEDKHGDATMPLTLGEKRI